MLITEFAKHARQLDSSVRGRYAPSPTGRLHLGNLQTALLAWLQVRLAGGHFVLRIEDLDQARAVDGGVESLICDLHDFGIDWDEGPRPQAATDPYIQSHRLAVYDTIFDYFKELGWVYPCFCSRREIRDAVNAPHGATPVYPGFCSALTSQEQCLRAKKKEPSWRFRVADQEVCFTDCVAGPIAENLQTEVGDFCLRRADGCYSYQFAVVIDDWMMGITDVLRGEDLLSSTCRQIALMRVLITNREELEKRLGEETDRAAPQILDGISTDFAKSVPRYWHTPLAVDHDGQRLSKRDGSDSLGKYRAAGISPERLIARICRSLGMVIERDEISAKELLSYLREVS